MLSRHAFRRTSSVLAASMALIIASCGGNADYGLGQMYPVSGTVTYNGQPLEKGQISFIPDDPKGVGADGGIENGSYSLGAVGDRNGARAGKYKVLVIAKEDPEAQAKAEFEKALAKTPDIAKNVRTIKVPPQYIAKATAEAKSLVPAGYGDLRTTTLTAEVKEQSNTIPFTLTDADAPSEPPKGAAPVRGKGRSHR